MSLFSCLEQQTMSFVVVINFKILTIAKSLFSVSLSPSVFYFVVILTYVFGLLYGAILTYVFGLLYGALEQTPNFIID